MRSVTSDHVGDLSEIYSDDVEIINIKRKNSASFAKHVMQMFDKRRSVELRWEQQVADQSATRRVLDTDFSGEFHELLSTEINFASEVLGTLLECDKIGVRLATLRRPMCPRFHVDQVPCRLLTTLGGVGTEWIAHNDVDFEAFADRGAEQPPLQRGAEVKQIPTGDWSLLKGGTWQDQFHGIVHRSPQGSGQRLLLSIDPVFDN